jgi:hypothetical protein
MIVGRIVYHTEPFMVDVPHSGASVPRCVLSFGSTYLVSANLCGAENSIGWGHPILAILFPVFQRRTFFRDALFQERPSSGALLSETQSAKRSLLERKILLGGFFGGWLFRFVSLFLRVF